MGWCYQYSWEPAFSSYWLILSTTVILLYTSCGIYPWNTQTGRYYTHIAGANIFSYNHPLNQIWKIGSFFILLNGIKINFGVTGIKWTELKTLELDTPPPLSWIPPFPLILIAKSLFFHWLRAKILKFIGFWLAVRFLQSTPDWLQFRQL